MTTYNFIREKSLDYYNIYYSRPAYVGIVLLTITFVFSLAFLKQNYISISIYILSLVYMRNIACIYGTCKGLAWINLIVYFVILYSSVYIVIYGYINNSKINNFIHILNNKLKKDIAPF